MNNDGKGCSANRFATPQWTPDASCGPAPAGGRRGLLLSVLALLALLAQTATAELVTWDVDPAVSYMRLTIPDQSLNVTNVGNVTILLLGVSIVLLLYFLKSLLGIDFFEDRHLHDFLPAVSG